MAKTTFDPQSPVIAADITGYIRISQTPQLIRKALLLSIMPILFVRISGQIRTTFIRAWAYATEELPTAAPARYLRAAGATMDNS